MQAMKEWYQEHPDLFHKRPYDRPGCDSRFIMLHDVLLSKARRRRLVLTDVATI